MCCGVFTFRPELGYIFVIFYLLIDFKPLKRRSGLLCVRSMKRNLISFFKKYRKKTPIFFLLMKKKLIFKSADFFSVPRTQHDHSPLKNFVKVVLAPVMPSLLCLS